jgi:hypothetical protein
VNVPTACFESSDRSWYRQIAVGWPDGERFDGLREHCIGVKGIHDISARQLAGRPKTGQKDAQWIARLAEMGLLRLCFVPALTIRGHATRDYHLMLIGTHRDHVTPIGRLVAAVEDQIEAAVDAIPAAWASAQTASGPGAVVLSTAEWLAEIPGVSLKLVPAILAGTAGHDPVPIVSHRVSLRSQRAQKHCGLGTLRRPAGSC